ncbi:MAG TPA: hypothetical protein VH371_06235 [Candidatus Limnocylindrales bacterium]|jgi:hypothetical protein
MTTDSTGFRGAVVVLLATASGLWLGLTANGLASALVVADLELSPVIALAIGAALGQFIFVSFVLASGVLRGPIPGHSTADFVMSRSTLIATWLLTPALTVALWNRHAHRLDSLAIEVFAEAGVMILIAIVAATLASVGAGRVLARHRGPR